MAPDPVRPGFRDAVRPARIGDRREAVRDAPTGRLAQFRGPLQQHRPGPVRLSAQPLIFRQSPFPLLSGPARAFLLSALPLGPLPVPAALPRFLPGHGLWGARSLHGL